MYAIDFQRLPRRTLFKVSIGLMALILGIALCSIGDPYVFLTCNEWAQASPVLAWLFSLINHIHETWFNILIMVLFNVVCLYTYPRSKRKQIGISMVIAWFGFQCALLCNHLIFRVGLDIHRISPSLYYDTLPRLSELSGMIQIKDQSVNSFPSGHCLLATYWILFSWSYTRNRLARILLLCIGFIFSVNRVLSGAHWLSDWFFSAILAWVYWSVLKYCIVYWQRRSLNEAIET